MLELYFSLMIYTRKKTYTHDGESSHLLWHSVMCLLVLDLAIRHTSITTVHIMVRVSNLGRCIYYVLSPFQILRCLSF
jgi:hypothetical protein